MAGDPRGTDAERKAWMDAQNAESARKRQAEYEDRSSKQQPEAAPAAEPKKSWVERAKEMGDKLKSEFNTAVEGVKALAPTPIEPGHGPTSVTIYNNSPQVKADPSMKL